MVEAIPLEPLTWGKVRVRLFEEQDQIVTLLLQPMDKCRKQCLIFVSESEHSQECEREDPG